MRGANFIMANLITVDFIAKHVTVGYESTGRVGGTLEDLEYEDILQAIDLESIVSFYGEEDLLKTIGKDKAQDHFNFD